MAQVLSRNHPPARHRRPPAPARVAVGRRPDIQGLRMLAVVAVVVNHLTGHPQGGFVGVDVFFVISGFLITGHLVRDLGRGAGGRATDGRPTDLGSYLAAFYRRRVRRLFPAALVVIVASTVVGHQVLDPVRFRQTWHDGLWATVFGANWHFIDAQTNYFTASGPDSAFEHYWSLSVEEQFYVVWPLALFGVASLFLALRPDDLLRRRFVVGLAGAGLTAVSYLYALHLSTADPTSAYFSTFTRAWELGLGAVLACIAPALTLRTPVLTVMSWTGLTAIVVSLFTSVGGAGFPAPGAVLPCVGSALVLAAASPRGRAHNVVLTSRVSVFVGDISYCVYLVHFPVIVLLAAGMGQRDGYYYLAAVVLTLGLSIALHGLVEQPVLRSGWLLPPADRARRRPRSQAPLMRLSAVGVLIAVLGAGVLVAWPGDEAALARRHDQIAQANAANGAPDVGPLQQQLSAALTSALAATSYPQLSPSIDSIDARPQVSDAVLRCGDVVVQPAGDCTFGPSSATHVAFLIGDSTAMGYAEALRGLVSSGDWKVRLAGAFGCNFSARLIGGSNLATQARCTDHNQADIDEIARTRPDLVLVSNTYEPRKWADTTHVVTDAEWTATLDTELSKIDTSHTRIAIVTPPVDDSPIRTCYQPGGDPAACVYRLTARWQSRAAAERALAASRNWAFVDSSSWFCVDGFCPAFANGVPTRFDIVHASTPYLQAIEPVIGEALAQQNLLGRQ